MGTYGPKLYQDDLAADVREQYIDRLHKGKTGAEITQEMLDEYRAEIDDHDDASVFWFALADTQWELGRLESKVKETALALIDAGVDLARWNAEDPKGAKVRQRVIEDLRQKLLTPQPPEKPIKPYRLYRCAWAYGDVFAYQLTCDLAKEKGLWGRYLLIRKIDETTWHPGHIVPIVHIKMTDGTDLPSTVAQYDQAEFVQTRSIRYEERSWPIDMSRPQADIAEKAKLDYRVDDYGFLPQYRVILLNTSKRVIPKSLIYLGNLAEAAPPQNEFIPHSALNITTAPWKPGVGSFEETMIRSYCGHNRREYAIYQNGGR